MARKKTFEEVEKNFNDEGYELLDKVYVNSQTPLKYKCPNGHINSMRWNDWQQNHRCPNCMGQIVTLEDVEREVKKRGFKLITKEYINAHTKIEVECPNGHIWKTKFNNFKRSGCPHCYGNVKYTLSEVQSIFKKYNYTLLSEEYIDNKQPLKYMCPKGHIGTMCLSNFLSGHRCGVCTNPKGISEGEGKIEYFLKEHNIEYKTQYWFKDCRNIKPLPFDFYLPKFELLIEFDGIQHFESGHFGDTEEDLKHRRYLDNIKNEYCKNKNIKLLRIPYWDGKRIDKILKQTLNLD